MQQIGVALYNFLYSLGTLAVLAARTIVTSEHVTMTVKSLLIVVGASVASLVAYVLGPHLGRMALGLLRTGFALGVFACALMIIASVIDDTAARAVQDTIINKLL